MRCYIKEEEMEIKYLQAVLAVAEHLSFSKAAEHTHMAQSSISRQVKIVEGELGAPLFDRSFSAGKVVLTEFGSQAIPVLKEIYERYESVVSLHLRMSRTEKQVYHLGVYRGPFNSFNKGRLASELYVRRQEIQVVVHEEPFSARRELLQRGTVDGFLYYKAYMKNDDTKDPEVSDWLERRTVFRKNPCIVMPSEHPLAQKEFVRFEDLRDEVFISHYDFLREGVHTGDIEWQGFLQSCLNAGFAPKLKIIPVESIADVRNIAVRSNGWMYPTFMTEMMKSPTGVRIVPIEDPIFFAKWSLLYTKAKGALAEKVIYDIRKVMTQGDATVF